MAQIPKPKIVTILVGANDCVTPTTTGDDGIHVSPTDFEQNINAMIDLLVSFSSDVEIILITPPRIDEAVWLQFCIKEFGYTGDVSDRLNYSSVKVTRIKPRKHTPCSTVGVLS